jgi:hypothetical protein
LKNECTLKGEFGMVQTGTKKRLPKFRGTSASLYPSIFTPRAKLLMGKSKVKIVRSKNGVVLAVGLREGKGGWYSSTILNKEKGNEFNFAARSKYFVDGKSVFMTNGNSILKGQGLGFFRFFLNHAIAIAKKESASKITIVAENEKLKEYYSKFGFKFVGLQGERKL